MASYREILKRKGYDTLQDYLQDVADTYGAELQAVKQIAAMLGPDELFDGLLSEVADMTGNPFMNVGDE